MTDKTKPTPAMKSKEEILTEYHQPPNSLDIGIRDGEPGLILDRILWTMESYANDKTTERTTELQKNVIRLRRALQQCHDIVKLHTGSGSDLFLLIDNITNKALRSFNE